MKNRAKCKLCGSIIESFHLYDYVTCKCGEIAVDGGTDYLSCAAKDFDNFLRVDDLGNEIEVKVHDSSQIDDIKIQSNESSKPNKKELLDMLKEMINNIERLPKNAMTTPITHSDFASALMLLLAILTED
jgi:hypothetical protein